ncbi:phosphatase [Clostridia bacterium]|nr:phosphatase [Clostridia bacterium]
MRIYQKSDIGRVRKMNQDSTFGEILAEKFTYAVVCDGMGGANGGEIASSMAALHISEYLKKHLTYDFQIKDIKDRLTDCFHETNEYIHDKSLNDENLLGMGTTAVLALHENDTLYVVNVGDSRAYRLCRDSITQLTTDHSIVQEMVDNGEITKEEARSHPQKNIITRVLGTNKTVESDFFQYETHKEDAILLCTDGLTNLVTDEEIYKLFYADCYEYDEFVENKYETFCEDLIKKANLNGGNDNITVALITD